MRICLTILFLLLLLTSCSEKKSNRNGIENHVFLNLDLRKSLTDTLDINWKGTNREKYPWSYFSDSTGICNLSNDTIIIGNYQGYGPSNSLIIKIANGIFEVDFFEHNCTYSHKYKVLKQRLELNRSTFQIGDTLTGKLFYQAVYVWDSIKNIVDTTTVSGKFKLKIRDKFFNWDSLDVENHYKELKIILSTLKPDTVTQLGIWKCGLTTLPIELCKFKNIENLVIKYNDLKSADLSMLSKFKKLKILQIDNCHLTEVPSSILGLKSLVKLSFFNNDISAIPTALFQLSKIEELQLGGNLLTSLPIEILKLKKLNMLDLSGGLNRNNIAKLPPNLFETLNHLTTFYAPFFMKKEEYKDYKPK